MVPAKKQPPEGKTSMKPTPDDLKPTTAKNGDPLGVIIERDEGVFVPYLQVAGPFDSELEAEQALVEAGRDYLDQRHKRRALEFIRRLDEEREAKAS
jgi:hypothetical protein